MSGPKARLTVTVDADLIKAGNRAVAAGRAKSLSSWVNLALAERVALEERLRAMAEAVAAYEAEHGVMTPDELSAQQRRDARDAIVMRGPRRTGARTAGPRSGAA